MIDFSGWSDEFLWTVHCTAAVSDIMKYIWTGEELRRRGLL